LVSGFNRRSIVYTRPEGRRSRRSLVVLAIIAIIVIDWAQEVGKGPLGDVAALLAGDHIREPEVDALVDAHVDHIGGGIREAIVGARLLGGGGVRVVTENVISSVPK